MKCCDRPAVRIAIPSNEKLAAFAVGLAIFAAGCRVAPSTSTPTTLVMPTATTTMQSEAAALSATPVATTEVSIQNFSFSPAVIRVPVGATVTWTNDDIEQHTVTARDKSYSSGAIANKQSYSFSYSKVGIYEYFCEIHPAMVGRVIVTAD